jgi:hypothetical protein
VEAQRDSVSVDDEHPLGAFPLLGKSNLFTTSLGRDKGAVEEGHGPIELALPIKGSKRCPPDALPDAGLSPPLQPSPDRCRRAILTGQVLPTTAGDKDIQDTFEGAPIIGARATSAGGRRQQRFDEHPLPVREMNPAHAGMLLYLASVLEPPLRYPRA